MSNRCAKRLAALGLGTLAIWYGLSGCGRKAPPIAEWFPFEKGYTWRVVSGDLRSMPKRQVKFTVDRVLPPDCESMTVKDATVQAESCRAILEITAGSDHSREFVPPSMIVTGSGNDLRINFLINEYSNDAANVPIQLEPELCLLRLPLLDGDSWQWNGKAIAIDRGDSPGRERWEVPASAVVTVRKLAEWKREAAEQRRKFEESLASSGKGGGNTENLQNVPQGRLDYEWPDEGVWVNVEMLLRPHDEEPTKLVYSMVLVPHEGIQNYTIERRDQSLSGMDGLRHQPTQWFVPERKSP